MFYLAKVENEIVTEVIVARSPMSGFVTIGRENIVGVGYRYENGEFTPPVVNEGSTNG